MTATGRCQAHRRVGRLGRPGARWILDRTFLDACIWVVVKTMVPFWVLSINGYLGNPKGDHIFDNHPYAYYAYTYPRGVFCMDACLHASLPLSASICSYTQRAPHIYIYIYMYTYIILYIYMHTSAHIYVHIDTNTCVCVWFIAVQSPGAWLTAEGGWWLQDRQAFMLLHASSLRQKHARSQGISGSSGYQGMYRTGQIRPPHPPAL